MKLFGLHVLIGNDQINLKSFYCRYFIPLKILFCFIIPTMVPVYFWGESWYCAFMSQAVLRYLFGLNFTWLVNSAAHMWGYRPYDKLV